MKLRSKAMSAALALMLTAALSICADASDYSFKGAMAPEYYPSRQSWPGQELCHQRIPQPDYRRGAV